MHGESLGTRLVATCSYMLTTIIVNHREVFPVQEDISACVLCVHNSGHCYGNAGLLVGQDHGEH